MSIIKINAITVAADSGDEPAKRFTARAGAAADQDGFERVERKATAAAADSGGELAERFAARAGAVDDQDGFEGFELLQPTDGRTTWLVVTRRRGEGGFNGWARGAARR